MDLRGDDPHDPADPFEERDQVIGRVLGVPGKIPEVTEHDRDVAFAWFQKRSVRVVSEGSKNGRSEELAKTGTLPFQSIDSANRSDDLSDQFGVFHIRFKNGPSALS